MLTGTWQGFYRLDPKNDVLYGKKEIPFIIHIIWNDKNGGFEGISEDDPDAYGIEMKSKIYGIKSKQEIRFVKIIDKTYYLPQLASLSGIQHTNENFEIYYKGTLNESGEYIGFWHSNPTFRKMNQIISAVEPSEGYWMMKSLR